VDYNINIRNRMGSGGKSASRKKLSAKGSIDRSKTTMNMTSKLKSSSSALGNVSSGSGGKMLGKVAGKSAIVGVILTSAMKLASFGISMYSANTGNTIRTHNARTTLKTIGSMGTNYMYGALKNEIFTKKVISRQNFGLDYGRELYQINVEGTKNKRI
jgi:hypothetical protein